MNDSWGWRSRPPFSLEARVLARRQPHLLLQRPELGPQGRVQRRRRGCRDGAVLGADQRPGLQARRGRGGGRAVDLDVDEVEVGAELVQPLEGLDALPHELLRLPLGLLVLAGLVQLLDRVAGGAAAAAEDVEEPVAGRALELEQHRVAGVRVERVVGLHALAAAQEDGGPVVRLGGVLHRGVVAQVQLPALQAALLGVGPRPDVPLPPPLPVLADADALGRRQARLAGRVAEVLRSRRRRWRDRRARGRAGAGGEGRRHVAPRPRRTSATTGCRGRAGGGGCWGGCWRGCWRGCWAAPWAVAVEPAPSAPRPL